MAWDFETEPGVRGEAGLDARASSATRSSRSRRSPSEWRTPEGREAFAQITDPLKEEVKRQGLWAAHLPPDMGGLGFGQVKLGLMHEILGQTAYGPSIFGNNAPDSRQRRADRRRRHRRAEGAAGCSRCSTARSARCFSMTEPGAGADPTLLTTTAVRDGDEWVINGHKWFSSNASIADFLLVMVQDRRPRRRTPTSRSR